MVELENKYQIGVRRFGLVNWVGAFSLYKKEVLRFLIVSGQTLIGPILTSILFLVVIILIAQRSKKRLDDVKKETDQAQAALRKIEKKMESSLTTQRQFQDYDRRCAEPRLNYFKDRFTAVDAPLKQVMVSQ